MNRFKILLISAAVFAVMSITASGHHSFALFDLTKRSRSKVLLRKSSGPIRMYGCDADVPQTDGRVRWGIEFTSINHLTRLGMKSNTIKAGDTIEFTGQPVCERNSGRTLSGDETA